jgi:indolepyruvate ferredoxin oxidoreductase beta subunit
VLLVGVGGQGVVTAARILGDAAHAAGLPVVVGQLHGMSQRGGSVECSVLFGPGRSSYLSRADIVVGFEPLEALRARHRMGAATKVLINTGPVVLPGLVRGGQPYPTLDRILADIRAVTEDIVLVDGPGALKEVGEARTLNVFMLGALQGLGVLSLDEATLWPAVARGCSPRYLEANRKAFILGRFGVADRGSPAEDCSMTGGGCNRE